MRSDPFRLSYAVCIACALLSMPACASRQSAASVSAPAKAVPAVLATVSAEPTPSIEATDAGSSLDGGVQRDYLSRQTKGDAIALGDPRRKAILDALRVVAERDLGQRVRFEVETLRTARGWAAIAGRPIRPDGGRIDYSHTQYAAWIKDGTFDEGVLSLLRNDGGRWRVVEYECGVTDSPGDSWLWNHKVNADLFWHPM